MPHPTPSTLEPLVTRPAAKARPRRASAESATEDGERSAVPVVVLDTSVLVADPDCLRAFPDAGILWLRSST